MEELEGEGLKEMVLNRLKRFREWLKPDPSDSILVQSGKMLYKGLALLVVLVFSPVILLILLLAFLAAF